MDGRQVWNWMLGVCVWLLLVSCQPTERPDVGSPEGGVPAECEFCPNDCCRLEDGGAACMNFSRRNPVTLECHCGEGPACVSFEVCCPPNNNPAPQMPPACLLGPSECDPRPTEQ
jgi:hypothetical protein